jgi:hypothetical protein
VQGLAARKHHQAAWAGALHRHHSPPVRPGDDRLHPPILRLRLRPRLRAGGGTAGAAVELEAPAGAGRLEDDADAEGGTVKVPAQAVAGGVGVVVGGVEGAGGEVDERQIRAGPYEFTEAGAGVEAAEEGAGGAAAGGEVGDALGAALDEVACVRWPEGGDGVVLVDGVRFGGVEAYVLRRATPRVTSLCGRHPSCASRMHFASLIDAASARVNHTYCVKCECD